MAASVGIARTDGIESATPAHTQTWVNAGFADAAAIGKGRSKRQPGMPLHNRGNAPPSRNLVEDAVKGVLTTRAERQLVHGLAQPREVPVSRECEYA